MFHIELIVRLLVAGVLGAVVGLERKSRFKEAGLRTHFIVSLGSALVMIVSKYGFADMMQDPSINLDPSRIAAQVVSGIGFLGAGAIIVQRQSVRGLTTAAGLWATSGIGLAVGAGMYWESIGATILVLIALEVLDKGQRLILQRYYEITLRTHQLDVVMAKLSELKIQIVDIRVKPDQEAGTEVYLQIRAQGKAEEFLARLTARMHAIPEVSEFKVK